VRRELFFDHALLPSGWARDVRISVADGTILAVAEGAAAAKYRQKRPCWRRLAFTLRQRPGLGR